MLYLWAGILGFVFLLLFDLCLLYKKYFLKYFFGLSGMILILGSTALILTLKSGVNIYFPLRIFFGVLMVLFSLLLLYSVFVEIGIEAYALNNKNNLVTTGTYSLSRHPGVLWFLFLYVSAFLVFQNYYLLYAGLIWTVSNIGYVYLQERFVFHKLFDNYESYIKSTPMLFPNFQSIERFITTGPWRKR